MLNSDRLAVGLLHWPMHDRAHNVVATNITNLDVHDIARACKVYGVERYYVIHPMVEQLQFVERLLDHWRVGEGSKLNSMRKTALTMVKTALSVEKAISDWGVNPWIITTHAGDRSDVPGINFKALREHLEDPRKPPIFLLFGTGFGMTDDFLKGCDRLLEPIRGAPPFRYRHLSVRSAVSICLDRLRGSW